MNRVARLFSIISLVGLLSLSLAAQTSSAARYDKATAAAVEQKLAAKEKFQSVHSSVEDGIVTLTGTVNLYQDKLDAAKDVRKMKNVHGVRNLITVVSPAVSDSDLREQLSRKLYYDRIGYFDNPFNYFTLSVKDGVVTVGGETYWDVSRDSALAIVQRTPGVKDVISEVKVSPTSIFDDQLRRRAVRAIYGDSVLSRYAIDPARPIRIIVGNGHLSLYGTVQSPMDKQIAGMRANGIPGAFSVQNNLVVESDAKPGM